VRKRIFLISACPLVLALAAGCGGSGHGTTSSQNEVPVVVTMHDAPPQGVTVLSFAVQVTGIKLEGSGSSSANLLSNPVTIQLQNLQTGNEVLAQSSAEAGTYPHPQHQDWPQTQASTSGGFNGEFPSFCSTNS
jgi:hypothetical protein